MNTQIKLTYNGEEYTLEYNRMVIKMLEQSGFDINEFMKKPMNNIELAFTAAFVKNHPNVQQTVIDSIFESCPNKNDLVARIYAMINECYDSLLSEPEKENSGNVSWEVVDLAPKKQK